MRKQNGTRINGSNVAYHYALRTVTRPGGVAVRLSGCEMAMFNELACWHPRAIGFSSLKPERRHVFVHRLRSKLADVNVEIIRTDAGYSLKL